MILTLSLFLFIDEYKIAENMLLEANRSTIVHTNEQAQLCQISNTETPALQGI